MAILNGGLLGTSRNKVGGIVSYRLRGQTVAREYVQTINNPRTSAQMVQRAKLINLVAAYRANQFWMASGAFESKKTTWSDYNAFVSANSLLSPVYLTRPMVAAGAGIVQPYQVARGSLPTIQTQWGDDFIQYKTDLYVGTERATTVDSMTRGILANNNGIREGDQISFVLNHQRIGNNGYPYILARAYELILDTTDTRNVSDIVPGLGTTPEGIGGNTAVNWAPLSSNALAGAAIILSRDTSGQIAVSNQSLVLTPSMATYVQQWQTSAAYQAYADSYGEGNTNFLAGGYSTIGSNGGVPITLQITGISSPSSSTKPVGGYGIEVNSGASYYVELSGSADGATELVVSVQASTGSAPTVVTIATGLSISDNTIGFPGSSLGGLNGQYITKIVATINGQRIEGTWRPDQEDGGDVS